MTTPTVCIIGLGLMGGSLALALRKTAGSGAGVQRIIGVGRRPETLAAALAAGAIDTATTDLADGVRDADIVVLATPARTILHQLREVGRAARPGALVLDLGSTKTEICAAMAELPADIQPVGGHPMCGKEIGGFVAAEAGLFQGKTFVLCPLPRTSRVALAQARSLVDAIGASVVILDPAAHDRAVAAISHLPYAAAVALVNAVEANSPRAGLPWSLASSGFRDTTRLAASEVEMMVDILVTNRDAVLQWLAIFEDQVVNLRLALTLGHGKSLHSLLQTAHTRRSGMKF